MSRVRPRLPAWLAVGYVPGLAGRLERPRGWTVPLASPMRVMSACADRGRLLARARGRRPRAWCGPPRRAPPWRRPRRSAGRSRAARGCGPDAAQLLEVGPEDLGVEGRARLAPRPVRVPVLDHVHQRQRDQLVEADDRVGDRDHRVAAPEQVLLLAHVAGGLQHVERRGHRRARPLRQRADPGGARGAPGHGGQQVVVQGAVGDARVLAQQVLGLDPRVQGAARVEQGAPQPRVELRRVPRPRPGGERPVAGGAAEARVDQQRRFGVLDPPVLPRRAVVERGPRHGRRSPEPRREPRARPGGAQAPLEGHPCPKAAVIPGPGRRPKIARGYARCGTIP